MLYEVGLNSLVSSAVTSRLAVAFLAALCQTGLWRTAADCCSQHFPPVLISPTLALSSCTDMSTIASLTALAAVATES